MAELLTIDGSMGEGGGQVLRSALALSMVTQTPFRIAKIRAGRAKPGLMRQHLTAVRAAVEVSGAAATGADVGSQELTFRPGPVRAGAYRFAVGTAGSTTLVFQTVLPALLLAGGPSTLTLEGGTHNPLAPPFEFLERVFLPLVGRMGPKLSVKLERHGFAPAGGGRFTASIEPAKGALEPLELLERGEVVERRGTALIAGLPHDIALRELNVAKKKLGWPEASLRPLVLDDAFGPGNALLLEIRSRHVTELFTGTGEKGTAAERVAERAAEDARAYLAADVPVGEHLADQLLLPLAMAGGGRFRTLPLTMHARTNMEVIGMFLPDVKLVVTPVGEKAVDVVLKRGR